MQTAIGQDVPQERSEVAREYDFLENVVNQLERSSDELVGRLAPITMQRPQSVTSETEDQSTSSEFAGQIRQQRKRLEAILYKVNEQVSSLAI